MARMIEEGGAPRRARAAGLTALLGVSGWIVVGALVYGLDELGVKGPRLNTGTGMAAAGAAVVILFLFAVGCAVALLAAVVFAVVRERRAPAAWRHAAIGAALAIVLPGLVVLVADANTNALVAFGVPATALFAASLFEPRQPFIPALAVPALAALGAFIVQSVSMSGELARAADGDRRYQVGLAAEASDAGALQAALDAFPQDSSDLDSELAILPQRGEHRAEIEQILRHPNTPQTPCTQLLRAALDGDATRWAPGQVYPYCTVAAANLAARQGNAELVQLAAKTVDQPDPRIEVLDQLVDVNDVEAAVRWMRAAGLSDARDRLRAEAMTPRLLNAMWGRDARDFYWAHSDLDALLVAIAGNDAYSYRVVEALEHGAQANARIACGATPLISVCTGHELNTAAIEVLLDGGADPNFPGARFCIDGEPAAPFETPLWHLVARRHDWNNLPSSAIYLLVKHGADPRRPSSDGGSLFDEAKDDENVLKALKGIDPYGE